MSPGPARRFLAALALAAFALLCSAPASKAGDEPLRLAKAYIKEDVTWSGTVLLTGQSVVKRGATLTLLPGTVVKFVWSDEDKNDIGDGELTVEGRLIAVGTKEMPILFTSAGEKPKVKDWTFVQISVSKDSKVEHCIFEYAFSGLQVHYSTATIKDSLFRYNYDGIRFSTTDITIEYNDLVNNYYGVRCEANGSRTTVRNNLFKGNEVGFFPVRKTGKSVKVHDNNFLDSTQYHVSLGQTQNEDLDFSGNWWGTADEKAIKASFFDKAADPALGEVHFRPFLDQPVKSAGRFMMPPLP